MTDPQLDVVWLITALQAQPFSKVVIHFTVHLFSLHVLVYLTISIKSLIEVKIDNTCYSPPIHQPSHLVLEGYQVGQAWLPFYKSVFNILNHILVLNVFGNAIQEDTISFPGMEVKLTDL